VCFVVMGTLWKAARTREGAFGWREHDETPGLVCNDRTAVSFIIHSNKIPVTTSLKFRMCKACAPVLAVNLNAA
jgi:hypothetical protein